MCSRVRKKGAAAVGGLGTNSCFSSSGWRGLAEDAEKMLNAPGRKMKAEGTRERTLEGEGGERKRGALEAICFSHHLKHLTFGSVALETQQDKVGTAQ